MIILGIETSCDETAIAVIEATGRKVRPRVRVLANVVLSQIPLHREFGGVVPNLAKREHQKNLVPALLRALREADLGFKNEDLRNRTRQINPKSKILNLKSLLAREPELLPLFLGKIAPLRAPRIDAIAVTTGPGLEPALWAGVNFSRALAYIWKKPLIPVNHLEGHIYTAMLGSDAIQKKRFHSAELKLPALTLIVSGGHTELVLMRKLGRYKIIGETRDDAAGEAFDKVGKMLGLPYPGGPAIERETQKLKAISYKLKAHFPRPMTNSNDFDFSFSGLKTAVLYFLRDAEKKHSLKELRPLVAAEFQSAVIDVLVSKTIRAAKKYRAKSIILGGGVAANKELRKRLAEDVRSNVPHSTLHLPSRKLTGDNALMIALAAYISGRRKDWQMVRAEANMRLDSGQ